MRDTFFAFSILLALAACASPVDDAVDQGTSDVDARKSALQKLLPKGDIGLLECSKADTGEFDFSVGIWVDRSTGVLEPHLELGDHHVVDPNGDTVSASGSDHSSPVSAGDRPEFFTFESDIPARFGHGGWFEPDDGNLPTSVVVRKTGTSLVAEGRLDRVTATWRCVLWSRTRIPDPTGDIYATSTPWKRVL